jgi:type II secretory pathway pseudopilin PulG
MNKRTPETGSVIFMILIAVILFAALSYVVAQMLRSGDANVIGEQQASIFADEILSSARQYRQGVQSLRISNGCADTDISFEAAALTGYAHSPAASDECKLFHADGGGAAYNAPSLSYSDGSDWIFNGGNDVSGVGTSAPDLVVILPNINLSVCNSINEKMGISDTGNDTTVDFSKFTGAYTSTQVINFAAGVAAGCLNYVSSGDNYFFYQTLVAR